MKTLIFLMLSVCAALRPALALEPTITKTQTYGVHLFFDEKEFVDVLTLDHLTDGSLSGKMHVPNDFDGSLTAVKISGNHIEFELFVPKNTARPKDLIFHYVGDFFDSSHQQLIGYVTIKEQPGFVASFVGFLR